MNEGWHFYYNLYHQSIISDVLIALELYWLVDDCKQRKMDGIHTKIGFLKTVRIIPCFVCHKSYECSTSGQSALTEHAAGKKH